MKGFTAPGLVRARIAIVVWSAFILMAAVDCGRPDWKSV